MYCSHSDVDASVQGDSGTLSSSGGAVRGGELAEGRGVTGVVVVVVVVGESTFALCSCLLPETWGREEACEEVDGACPD